MKEIVTVKEKKIPIAMDPKRLSIGAFRLKNKLIFGGSRVVKQMGIFVQFTIEPDGTLADRISAEELIRKGYLVGLEDGLFPSCSQIYVLA